MTIFKLQLSNLKNGEHYNLMEFTANATVKYPYITETFPVPVSQFKDAFDKENDAYLKSTRSFITKQIQAAHETRILRFRSLNARLYSASTCADPAAVEAGEFLLDIVKDYGGESKIVRMRVDSMSGVLTNLVEDFQERFADKVEAAGATQCTEELRIANETYKTLRSERTEEVSEHEKAAMRDARTACDTEWRGLIDSVNLRYHYEQDELLLPFMRYMNTEIDWYRTLLKQRPGNSDTNFEGGEETGGEGSEGGETTPPTEQEPTTPTQHTIKYMHNGQVYSTQQLEAGATITPPAAPAGYYWVNVPSRMPAQDLTIHSAEESDLPPALD